METDNQTDSDESSRIWTLITVTLVTVSVIVVAMSMPYVVTLIRIISMIRSFAE